MRNQSPQRSHWADEPLGPSESDALGRAPFVKTVSDQIELVGLTDPSTVFGLVGSWGSGKTSILNQVQAVLADDWLVADFSPWSSGDSAAMSLEFVRTLSYALDPAQEDDKVQKSLLRYASYAAPLLGAVPVVGSALAGTANKALEDLAHQLPWQKQFEELAEQVQKHGKRVLIIVDDVDRLGGQELLTLLKVLRLLGRFRGVHYLIAYDQDTVEDLLRSTGAVGRSASFMEKIVQYPFETPPVPRAAAARLLDNAFQALLDMTQVKLSPSDLRRANSLLSIIAPRLSTPRTIGRFREYLLAFAPHVKIGQLDLLDYVGVTWLRLSAHGVWARLEEWSRMLRIGSKPTDNVLHPEPVSEEDWAALITSADASAHVSSTMELLAQMFSGVKFQGATSYTSHSHSISEESYFGRYLLLAVPEDDISDELIEDVITDQGGEARMHELAQIIDGPDGSLASLAVARYSGLRETHTEADTRLLGFIKERLAAREQEEERLGSPLIGLQDLLTHEMVLVLTTNTMDASSVIDALGEQLSLRLLSMAMRPLGVKGEKNRILRQFARYWLGELPSRIEALRESGMLRLVAELLTEAAPAEKLEGLLDHAIGDYNSYLDIAEAFVYFESWVGSSVTYNPTFRSRAFLALVSAGIRERYRPQVTAEAGKRTYPIDDLPSPDINPADLRAFTVDSLKRTT